MSATDPVWMASFTTIRDTHDRVYATIDTAIQCEEAETPQLAIVNYKLSVMLIDQALETPVGLPGDADDQQVFELDETWDQACLMVQKMRRTRGELLQRIATLSTKAQASPLATVAEEQDEEFVLAVDCSAAPAAASATTAAAASGERPWTHSELSKVLQQTVIESAEMPLQLIYTCDGVRLYHITAGGDVSTSVENSVLRILCMPGNTERRLQATFFMQIIDESISVDASPDRDDAYDVVVDGVPIATDATSDAAARKFDRPWLYPLVPGVSPCYYTKFGAFIFPDLYADGDLQLLDASVGIVVPADVELVVLDVLDAILLDVVREEKADADEESEEGGSSRSRRSTSELVSDNIVRGASYISRGLLFSSTKVGDFVERNTPYVMSKMTRVPQADDGERPVVSRGVVTGMAVAKKATGVAASLTGYVAEKVGVATMALGRYLSPHVQTTGSSLLTHTMGYSQEEAADKVNARPKGGAIKHTPFNKYNLTDNLYRCPVC